MEKRTCRVLIHSGEDLTRRRIEFSDDAKWMFVCCGSHVKVYSYSSGKVAYTLDHHTKEVTGVALHPRNRMQLFSSSLDGQLALWDYIDGALLRVIDLATPLFQFVIRPGRQEPLLFFSIKQDKYVIVGVSSQVITERQPTVAPSNQLTEARQFLTAKSRHNEFTFSSEGAYLATYDKKKLMVCDLEADTEYKYFSDFPFTALAFHPSKLCIATGNQKGQIQLWYDVAMQDREVVVTTFHWHAHSVRDLCFTTDGTYLLSGGEESVLVLWQLDTHTRQFRPRLGSPIVRVACSPGDSYFCISLQSNAIQLISGLDTDVKYTLGGLRRAHSQNPDKHGIKTGLVLEPHSNSIVLNSTPGFIQFYQPITDSVIYQLNVTGLNYISRPDDKPLTLTTVTHVAMSTDGFWLATVEERDDRQTTPELRMKFWEFSKIKQCFTLNTCVEPPHNQTITSLTFQPKWLRTGASFPYMAATTSKDGDFKTWVVVDGESSGRGKERKEGGACSSWACRSVGHYLCLPCYGSVFCEDGSLLAVNFHKYITVWDPYSCDLRATFNSQFPREMFRNMVFGHGSSSQYLLASTSSHLHTWNLLTCTVVWCLQVSVSLLVSDPFSSVTAAFVTTTKGKEKKTHLYLFDPSNPTPLAVHGSVCNGCIIGGVFVPNEDAGSTETGSKLYFMDKNQLLCAVHSEETDASRKTTRDEEKGLSSVRKEHEAQSSFYEIFGDTAPGKKTAPNLTLDSQPSTKARNFALKVLSAPPHVLPPMGTLCHSFLTALLPLNKSSGDSVPTGEGDDLSDYSDADVCGDSESESEEGQREGRLHLESQLEPTDSNDRVGTAMEVDGESLRTTAALESVGDYGWLTDHFCRNHI